MITVQFQSHVTYHHIIVSKGFSFFLFSPNQWKGVLESEDMLKSWFSHFFCSLQHIGIESQLPKWTTGIIIALPHSGMRVKLTHVGMIAA